jgi:hypothetical protein
MRMAAAPFDDDPFRSAPSSTRVFRTASPFVVPIGGVLDVPILVFGLREAVRSVSVSLHIRHQAIGTLNLAVANPAGRVVLLSALGGGQARSLGESCVAPALFDDAAPCRLDEATPSYAGPYRPLGRLAELMRTSDRLEGCWRVAISDVGTTAPMGALLACAALIFRS